MVAVGRGHTACLPKPLGDHGHWAFFAEFTDVYAMQHDLAALISAAFEQMVNSVLVRIEPRII